jgi:hypothetical protein
MVKLTHILFATLFLCANVARADESDRDRKARVALALTASSAKPAPKGLCACGDACECAAGKCPACPAASKPAAAPAVTYREVWYSDGRRVWRQLEPFAASEGCPNGRCAIPR